MTSFTKIGKNYYGTAHIKIKVYDGCKYSPGAKKVSEVEYNIVRWGVFNLIDLDDDTKENIYNNDMFDEYDEYLKIWTKDEGYGSESMTFRNSHVDMFMI